MLKKCIILGCNIPFFMNCVGSGTDNLGSVLHEPEANKLAHLPGRLMSLSEFSPSSAKIKRIVNSYNCMR